MDSENSRLDVTTPRLLSLLTKKSCLKLERIYKLLKINYPVIVGSIRDMNRVFHVIIIWISRHEVSAEYEFVMKTLI